MCSIGDSVDLVPIAAFHGRGKRTGENHENTLDDTFFILYALNKAL